ncbi:MAG: PilZ domain-containing protein [Candidatus Omnitrophica bacterium]|nr:PilZ domain-containing protein [Candidatus Omnitrophota bacterium]
MLEQASEQRIFERHALFMPASFHDTDSHARDQVFLSEICSSGLRLKTQNRLFYRDQVKVNIHVPGQDAPVMLEGHVVWAKIRNDHMWDVGVKFLKPLLVELAPFYNF